MTSSTIDEANIAEMLWRLRVQQEKKAGRPELADSDRRIFMYGVRDALQVLQVWAEATTPEAVSRLTCTLYEQSKQ